MQLTIDVKDIAVFIAEDSPSASKRFVQSLFQAVERLADFPESGGVVPQFGGNGIERTRRRPSKLRNPTAYLARL